MIREDKGKGMIRENKGRDGLIVALDVDTEKKALELIEVLKGEVKIFKVGSELFTSAGPGIIRKIRNKGGIREDKGKIGGGKGCEIFLDLKFHDIPNTVAKAAAAATRLEPFMLNVHTLGGYDMMKRAAEAVRDEAARHKISKPKLIGVTVLTSMDENGLKKVGINDNIKSQVLRLAALAKEAGLDGVVASPVEAKYLRDALGSGFLIVTPGVRPGWWAAKDDQERIATPKEAIASGADYIVVGRPIIEADDPLEAARKILEEID